MSSLSIELVTFKLDGGVTIALPTSKVCWSDKALPNNTVTCRGTHIDPGCDGGELRGSRITSGGSKDELNHSLSVHSEV